MRNPVANGVALPQLDVTNDAVEAKPQTEEQEILEKFSPSRQHSMRRSRTSGELDRDGGIPALQPSPRLQTATSLNPVTPLRWKSSKRVESERKKLQDEIKTKEVVKEEIKNSKSFKDVRKEQIKTTAALKREVNGMETSNKADSSITYHATSQEADTRPVVSSAAAVSVVPTHAIKNSNNGNIRGVIGSTNSVVPGSQQETNQVTENSQGIKSSLVVTPGGSNEQAKASEEASSVNAEQGTDRSNADVPGTDRKTPTGEETSVITIDFLRARLLAERASSKAAKEQIQQLTKRVLELESKLDQEIGFRKKAEEIAQEALLKLQPPEKDKPSTLSEEKEAEPHDKEFANSVEEKGQVSEDHLNDERTKATDNTNSSDILSPNLTVKEGNEVKICEDIISNMSEQEDGGIQTQNVSEKFETQEAKEDTLCAVPGVTSASGDIVCPANSEIKRQENRFEVKERLRSMWDQLTKEMAALAEDNTEKDFVQLEILNWMGQVPSVLQDVVPKQSENERSVTESSTENSQPNDADVSPPSSNVDQIQREDPIGDRSLDGAQCSGKSAAEDKGLKKVASLIERFEAQENIPREWEQNYTKQHSVGGRRSREGSMSRTNSTPGTPNSVVSQQESQQEQSGDVPSRTLSQIGDLNYCSPVPNSPISSSRIIGPENPLLRKENDTVDTCPTENNSSSSYLYPPIVEETASRTGGEGTAENGNHETKNLILDHEKFEVERSLDPSFITPPLLRTSSGSRACENRDIMSDAVNRSQFLKHSNHYQNSSAGSEGRYDSLPSHSGRSNAERGEPAGSQPLVSWVMQEVAHSSNLSINKGKSSSQWVAPSIGLHQRERMVPYSQAGNSNAYIRPEVSGNYPLRNDEREIYRGRMESVSRSMEGLGFSWRSSSDPEGDDILTYADIPDSFESGTTRSRSGPLMPFQVDGGSGRLCYNQGETMMVTSASFTHSGGEISRENYQTRASNKIESTTSKVNEVLKALQLAKLSIQNTGARRSSISNSSELSYPGGEKNNRRAMFGASGGGGTTYGSPTAPQEISRMYSTDNFREAGSPTRLEPACSTRTVALLMDSRRKDAQKDRSLAGRSSPVSNAHRKFVSKFSMGGGVQYV
ncbi:uncharacterized protein [Physcomitrium patens]|uniref:Uncharacterized protein n=1 Tax=Physcomitrium patens TaxID=3218 RepID=A0A2K1K616_PHYPA|nr:uncharacterized protein LOC112285988 [Physcomitrium patens]XP_024383203.1 uncharacterized protein LOC112285988 [Physcomitrium patens]XP_024383204.1 uncharacterized protein LOC112285988 [Physcomitrium patens]XP_024383205.1 uncharacterized protein LOC112285988 [Physcomitrium patens]XP_024383206.1 uncharacterized protein LOC112285988 [Physcomitrium patens]XP_024383207.1 uncharacterized protein LOC112285988 [Physcomitrium patens]XP_024383208.1 uncharacterized protein LOC112285988 [Physcomitriu|eukprot:XP_024383202.1 uncharacterized protein LOC112285988 [Physcomitrella patens]